jgi:hypothetical protein
MTGDPDYRSVTSEVRTPRFAAFIDESSPYWRTDVAALVRIFSQTWGGKYFLIVPTDGKRITNKFWELLEAYSPDRLGLYEMTLADLQEADPERYRTIMARWRKDWKFDNQDFDEWFETQQYHSRIGNFAMDPALQQELKNRLAPFHHGDHIIDRLGRDYGLSFPFTKVTDINPHAHQPINKLVLPKKVDDLDMRVMVLSQSGDLDKPTREGYENQAVAITTLPDNYQTEDMVKAVIAGAVDPLERSLARSMPGISPDGVERWAPDEDYVKLLPFQASMLHRICSGVSSGISASRASTHSSSVMPHSLH